MKRLFILISLGVSLPMLTKAQMTTEQLAVEGVSRELGLRRAGRISDLRYEIHLQLQANAARVQGREKISFKLANATEDVILDFRDLDAGGKIVEGAIRNVKLNDQSAEGLRQVNGHIVFSARSLKPGENVIMLDFETGAAPAGRPLIRYQDTDDGSEYLYTLFVPMDASLAFPCFDQPDLKARFTLSADKPEGWTVITNTEAKSASPGHVEFQETHPISTYLFAFAAGPFKKLEGEAAPLPIHLYVRQSKLARAKEEWPEALKLTSEGMKHFVSYFDRPFPFPKYDQVLIPGFAYGGMEHAGATFLREDSILFRAVPTRNDKLGRASLILHELAHQWFGDLVTMKWFDDLWLKEGFANYMASHAMAAIYSPEEIWKRFYQSHKPVAYQIDSTKGTTPIYQEVGNLKDAKSAYGAIVYQKAPSLLHAMSFLIGEEKFRDGVRSFLRQHAYANAEWNDLIRAFEKAANQKLAVWANAWVKRRGMPQVNVEWSCDGAGRIDRFELRQSDVQGQGRAWPVKSRVLLAYDDAEPLRFTAELNGPRIRSREAIGKKCPAFVFANERDYGYGRFMLDARSRDALTTRIATINDPFLRTMLWGALWDAVREIELKPMAYLDLAEKSLPGEKDEELTQSLLTRSAHAFVRYLSSAQQKEIAPRWEALLFDRMMNAGALDARITYFRAFRSLASTAGARMRLKEMLDGKLIVPGVEIKPLDRWQIVTRLVIAGDEEAIPRLDAERKRDVRDDGRKQAYIAKAARADAGIKKRYFDDYLGHGMPEDWIEGSLGAFNAWNQSDLTLHYLKPALEALPRVKRERKIFFVLAWLNAFIGGQRSSEALGQVDEFLRTQKLDRDLELKVLEVMDELERTVRIRTRADGDYRSP